MAASAWTAAARRIVSSHKSISTPQIASLTQSRGLAGGGDHHGSPKVNFWEDPLNPSKWKREHFVIVSLAGGGLVLYGGYEFFTRGKKEEKVGDGAR